MMNLSFAMEAEDCRRWAKELAGEPEQRLLEKLAREFARLAAAEGAVDARSKHHLETACDQQDFD